MTKSCTFVRNLCSWLSLLLLLPGIAFSQSAKLWITSGNKNNLFQSQPALTFGSSGSASYQFTIDPSVALQTIDGFGYCLTEGSCEAIASLSDNAQNSLLQDLFNPSSGLGISVLRISIGASDLSSSSYSYNENSDDVSMSKFSLSGPDQVYLIPMLKKILAINPQVKILATPWSAPKWMKTSNSWVGGSLKPELQGAYATYFVKYLQAMQAQGINIWAITPQNEPLNPNNEPSMYMTSSQQLNFVDKNLGPAMHQAGFTNTKIIAYDHNCIDTNYPKEVCTSSYVDGSAFHMYDGDISALSDVHTATGKNVYFTEQYIGGNSNFNTDLGWHMRKVVLGSVLNWSKIALEWNLASFGNFTPRTPGGCTDCQGAITIDNSNITKNLAYYLIGHMSKVVKPGAVRIQSNSYDNMQAAAFKNTDGTIGFVVMNYNDATSISIKMGSKYLSYNIPAVTVASFIWTESSSPIIITTPQATINTEQNATINIPFNVAGGSVSKVEYIANGILVGSSTAAPFNLKWTPTNAGQTNVVANAYDANGNFASSVTVQVNVISYQAIPGTIQAESYNNASGNLKSENCSDTGGGLDMGYLSIGDYMEYNVNVSTAGKYALTYRIAGTSAANFSLLFEGSQIGTYKVPSTGGYQSWQTMTDTLQLNAGKQTMRLKITAAGWNLNYLVFDLVKPSSVFDSETYMPEIHVFPNPTNNDLYIKGDFNAMNHIDVELMTTAGEIIKSENFTNIGSGSNMELKMKELPAGIYFLKIIIDQKICFRKVVKN